MNDRARLLLLLLLIPVRRAQDERPLMTRRLERAQGTVEYALVLLGAAAIALLVVAWVGRTDLVGRLFDTVVGRILTQAE
jgi:hypothetical protein